MSRNNLMDINLNWARKPRPYVLMILGLVLVLALSGCDLSLAEDITPPPGSEVSAAQVSGLPDEMYPAGAPNPLAGGEVYQFSCLPCHGETGLGDGPAVGNLPVPAPPIGAAALADAASPEAWFTIVTLGNMDNFMPPFANDLSDENRWDVLAYVYSLSTSPVELEAGQEVYAENCAGCHGSEGQGDGPDVEGALDFTDQEVMSLYSRLDIIAAISAEGQVPAHNLFAGSLGEPESRAAAAYVRSLTFPTTTVEELTAELGLDAEPAPEIEQPETSPTEEAAEGSETDADPHEQETPSTATLNGQVLNGSGGEVPDGLVITLSAFDHFEEAFTEEIEMGPDGTFEFSDLEIVDGRMLFVSTDYQGMTFSSDFAVLSPTETEFDLTFEIFDVTHSASELVAERVHIFFEFLADDTVQVVQLWVVSNPSNQGVVPASPTEPALVYPLPEGATNLLFDEGALGERFVETGDGFGDTRPVLPQSNEYQLIFAYTLPYSRSLDFSQPLAMDIEIIQVFVQEGIDLETEGLTAMGSQDLNGTPFTAYTGADLAAGDAIDLSLKGRNPSAGPAFSIETNTQSLLIGGAALLLVVAVVLWWYGGKSDAAAEYVEEYDFDDSNPEDVMDEIIALDEAYEAGEIGEQEYNQARAALKQDLQDLLDE